MAQKGFRLRLHVGLALVLWGAQALVDWLVDIGGLNPLDALAGPGIEVILQRLLVIAIALLFVEVLTVSSRRQLEDCEAHIVRLRERVNTAHQQAGRDMLTGALNRSDFDSRVRAEMNRARQYRYPLSVIMFDIDHFARINRDFDHETGDRVLEAVAQAVTMAVRGSDILFRYGGEKFVVLAPNTDSTAAGKLAEKLRAVVQGLQVLPERSITLSLGVTQMRPDDNLRMLIDRADDVLSLATDKGRDRTERAE